MRSKRRRSPNQSARAVALLIAVCSAAVDRWWSATLFDHPEPGGRRSPRCRRTRVDLLVIHLENSQDLTARTVPTEPRARHLRSGNQRGCDGDARTGPGRARLHCVSYGPQRLHGDFGHFGRVLLVFWRALPHDPTMGEPLAIDTRTRLRAEPRATFEQAVTLALELRRLGSATAPWCLSCIAITATRRMRRPRKNAEST